jgi:hypothetical protein
MRKDVVVANLKIEYCFSDVASYSLVDIGRLPEELTACSNSVVKYWSISTRLRRYILQDSQPSSCSSPWDPEISPVWRRFQGYRDWGTRQKPKSGQPALRQTIKSGMIITTRRLSVRMKRLGSLVLHSYRNNTFCVMFDLLPALSLATLTAQWSEINGRVAPRTVMGTASGHRLWLVNRSALWQGHFFKRPDCVQFAGMWLLFLLLSITT